MIGEAGNGHAVEAQAMVQIVLLADGNVMANLQGPLTRMLVNALCESGRQLLLKKVDEAEKNQSGIVAAQPSFRLN